MLDTSVKDTFEKIFQVYDEKIRPAFEGIADGLSSLLGVILDTYNQYIAPVFDELSEKFAEVWQEHVQPVIDKAVELFGKLAECVSVLWKNVLEPWLEWIVSTVVPILAPVFEILGKTVLDVFGAIADTIGGFMEILGGVLDFITGIFTGDWNKCWEGITAAVNGAKDMMAGILEQITAIFRGQWNVIKSIINSILGGVEKMANGVVRAINGVIRSMNALKFDIPDWVPGMGGKSFGFNIGQVKGVSIPRLAKGGIVSTPTLAMMGENNKKEAVVPLERNLEWRDAIAGKIVERMGAGGSGGGLTAAEVRGIMMEAVNMFAQLISQMEMQAVISSREIYKAAKKEYNIENKPKGRTVI